MRSGQGYENHHALTTFRRISHKGVRWLNTRGENFKTDDDSGFEVLLTDARLAPTHDQICQQWWLRSSYLPTWMMFRHDDNAQDVLHYLVPIWLIIMIGQQALQ